MFLPLQFKSNSSFINWVSATIMKTWVVLVIENQFVPLEMFPVFTYNLCAIKQRENIATTSGVRALGLQPQRQAKTSTGLNCND